MIPETVVCLCFRRPALPSSLSVSCAGNVQCGLHCKCLNHFPIFQIIIPLTTASPQPIFSLPQLTLIVCYISFSFTAPLKQLLMVYEDLLEVIVQVTNQSSTVNRIGRTISHSILVLDGEPLAVEVEWFLV